jgi:hypothetical protein
MNALAASLRPGAGGTDNDITNRGADSESDSPAYHRSVRRGHWVPTLIFVASGLAFMVPGVIASISRPEWRSSYEVGVYKMGHLLRTGSALAIVAFSLIAASQIQAQPQCSISDEKKRLIMSGLCGDMAKESDYKFSGPNCVANSVRKRFQDSAAQIIAYRTCGDEPFSVRLKFGTLRAAHFIQILSACSQEKIDVEKIMDEAMAYAQQHISSLRCEDVRRMLADRKSSFEQMMQQAHDPTVEQNVYDKIGISVDGAGNVTDKK